MMSIWEFLSQDVALFGGLHSPSVELGRLLWAVSLFSVACGPAHDGHFNRSGLLYSRVADAHPAH